MQLTGQNQYNEDAQCDMPGGGGGHKLKGSDWSGSSVYFLLCGEDQQSERLRKCC